jgi:hypothetical protein
VAGKPRAVTIVDGEINFLTPGEYSLAFVRNKVKIHIPDGSTKTFSSEAFFGAESLNLRTGANLTIDASVLDDFAISGLDGILRITGINFVEAEDAPNNLFEPDKNLDTALGSAIDLFGAGHVAQHMTVNGSQGDAFKLIWDYLDDAYVAGNNYYNLDLNENFVRLGVEYASYLAGGGEPLSFIVAKFSPDGGDGDSIPERAQSMHDNLLGNLSAAALNDRFSGNPALLAELLALVPDEYEGRPVYSGSNAAVGGAAHDAVRAFDYDKGWDRPDYIDHAFGLVDDRASETDGVGGSMYYGSGNGNGAFNIIRHEGAGFELALKVKEYGIGDYLGGEAQVDGNEVHYTVPTGPSALRPDRADWSIDFAATVTAAGDDDSFVFKLFMDLDPSNGETLVEIPIGIDAGSGLAQDSFNYAFISAFIDIDPVTDGIQPYAFGEGEFAIELRAYESAADGGDLLAINRITVSVVDPLNV